MRQIVPYLRDFVDGKERPAKPEEIVRQLFPYRLIHTYGYPTARISVEKGVYFGSEYKPGVDGKSMIDNRGHMIIDHDLDEIATAFVDFAKKQKFSFWREG